MTNITDMKRIVRLAAIYGASMKEMPLQLEAPDSMDPDEHMQLMAAANSVFAQLRSLKQAGLEPAAITLGCITAAAAMTATECPADVRDKFTKVVQEQFAHFTNNVIVRKEHQ